MGALPTLAVARGDRSADIGRAQDGSPLQWPLRMLKAAYWPVLVRRHAGRPARPRQPSDRRWPGGGTLLAAGGLDLKGLVPAAGVGCCEG